jgi:tripartite-type tricarboxylate transporter receptor subunit TctC
VNAQAGYCSRPFTFTLPARITPPSRISLTARFSTTVRFNLSGLLNRSQLLSLASLRAMASRMLCFALVLGASLLAHPVMAQNAVWPTKTVRIVAPFPPGGSVDQVARLVAQQLALQTGQNFIVENKTGASGAIGTQLVAKSEPDGHTLVIVFDTHSTNPTLIPNIGFNTMKDLAPITLIGTAPMAVVAHASQPYNSFADLLAASKAKPGSVSYGSIGSGSLGHLAMTQIGNLVSTEFNHVPYRGGGPLMIDAVGGQIGVALGTVFLVNPHIKSGKLKALGVTSLKADPQLPGVAPIADQGVPGYNALAWWGAFAPAATPAPVLKRLHEEFVKALRNPAIAEKLSAQGMDLSASTPQELQSFVQVEIDRWAKVIQQNKIRAGD